MSKHPRMSMILPVAMAALLLVWAAPIWAGDDDDGEVIPLDVADIYFELNDTDGDLGIHALIDGEPWKILEIEGPRGRKNLQIRLRSSLRRQGLTELFFESAEPSFDELDPEQFFRRFPEGEYEVEGVSIEGDELVGTSIVTHLIPAPVGNLAVNGMAVSEDCDMDPGPSVSEPIIVSWEEVTLSHPDLGRTNEPIEVVRYEAVVEQEETEVKVTILLPSDATSVEMPAGLLSPGEVKVEVLVREASGNQTALESCFEVE
jgi:hypothetical protein